MISKEQLASWLNLDETKQILQWLKDCRLKLINDDLLGYNPSTHVVSTISKEDIPYKNYILGQVEILSLLTNLEYEVIRNFYLEIKEVQDGELDTDE